MRIKLRALAVLVGVLTVTAPAEAAKRRRPPLDLLVHVENSSGAALESTRAEESFNPASVVKVATSLWALERLGPEFRFETRIFARGTFDPATGRLDGDLVVQGGADPDFHAENAFLVADALNRIGVREVTGAIVVNQRFWMGWENGSAGTDSDPFNRGLTMAGRLRQGLDPHRWTGAIRHSWRELAIRRALDPAKPPRVAVRGGVGVDGEVKQGELLVVHRSKPLMDTLRRFNAFSNNDIERLGAVLGPVEELAALVAVRCGVDASAVAFETTSGLGTNRLSPRLVVRLLRELRATCARLGIALESVLPVAGCDPGTVTRFFPNLAMGENASAVVGKTGTLTNTDGGVAVVAGFANTADGDLAFCLAVPRAQGRLKGARVVEERYILDLLSRHGGPRPRSCAPPLPEADTGASMILVAGS